MATWLYVTRWELRSPEVLWQCSHLWVCQSYGEIFNNFVALTCRPGNEPPACSLSKTKEVAIDFRRAAPPDCTHEHQGFRGSTDAWVFTWATHLTGHTTPTSRTGRAKGVSTCWGDRSPSVGSGHCWRPFMSPWWCQLPFTLWSAGVSSERNRGDSIGWSGGLDQSDFCWGGE